MKLKNIINKIKTGYKRFREYFYKGEVVFMTNDKAHLEAIYTSLSVLGIDIKYIGNNEYMFKISAKKEKHYKKLVNTILEDKESLKEKSMRLFDKELKIKELNEKLAFLKGLFESEKAIIFEENFNEDMKAKLDAI